MEVPVFQTCISVFILVQWSDPDPQLLILIFFGVWGGLIYWNYISVEGSYSVLRTLCYPHKL
jgi:hypothetical protein